MLRKFVAAGRRERAEEQYRRELEQAILVHLGFVPEHSALAEEIARRGVRRPLGGGGGRPGGPDAQAGAGGEGGLGCQGLHPAPVHAVRGDAGPAVCRGVLPRHKTAAQDEGDEFLERHRRTGGAPGPGGPGEAEA